MYDNGDDMNCQRRFYHNLLCYIYNRPKRDGCHLAVSISERILLQSTRSFVAVESI